MIFRFNYLIFYKIFESLITLFNIKITLDINIRCHYHKPKILIVKNHSILAHQNLYFIEEKCPLTNKIIKYVKGNFLGKGGFARCY